VPVKAAFAANAAGSAAFGSGLVVVDVDTELVPVTAAAVSAAPSGYTVWAWFGRSLPPRDSSTVAAPVLVTSTL
jgi:hypothetical protein